MLRNVMEAGARPLLLDEPLGRCSDIDEEAAIDNSVYVKCIDEAIRHDQRLAAQRALDRMRDGSYGLCQDCGKPLPAERLTAVPWAHRCVRCQAGWERHEILARCA
jgi:phage/conjugal plasmid C-4 type zinc finger TraR family protein